MAPSRLRIKPSIMTVDAGNNGEAPRTRSTARSYLRCARLMQERRATSAWPMSETHAAQNHHHIAAHAELVMKRAITCDGVTAMTCSFLLIWRSRFIIYAGVFTLIGTAVI